MSQNGDSVTGKPVKDKDQAKGFERGEDENIILTDDDLAAVELETVRTIDIEKFVPATRLTGSSCTPPTP